MLNNEAQAATVTKVLDPVSAAATANATSGWIDCHGEGDVEFLVSVGAITGSHTPSFQDGDTSAGGNAASITPNEGAPAALTANTVTRYTFNCRAHRGWIKYIGTIVTGPTLISVVSQRRPKYTS